MTYARGPSPSPLDGHRTVPGRDAIVQTRANIDGHGAHAVKDRNMNDNKVDSIADALAIAFVAALLLFFAASVIKMYW